MRRNEVAFNESSALADLTPDDIQSFLDMIVVLAGQQDHLTMLNVGHIYTAANSSFWQLMEKCPQRDQFHLMLMVAGRCPAGHGGFESEWQNLCVQLEGVGSVAGAIAKSRGAGLVSVGRRSKWQVEELALSCDADSSSDQFRGVLVNCFNAESGGTYFGRWVRWARAGVNDPACFWKFKRDLYPRLSFLDGVRKQLNELESESLDQVLLRMAELADCVDEWAELPEGARPHQPQWRSKVTPESRTRRDDCYFLEGGVRKLFDLHARYTPGAGRIHFRVDGSELRIVVAYVGWKLGE